MQEAGNPQFSTGSLWVVRIATKKSWPLSVVDRRSEKLENLGGMGKSLLKIKR